MARKVVNRKQLREEADAAEKKGAKKKKMKAAKKRTPKAAAEGRLQLYWGVFSQSMKRVALFEFNQRKQAEKKALDLNKTGKSPHFVQRVKEAIEEE